MRFIDKQKLQTNHFMTMLEDGNADLFSRATNHGCSYNYTFYQSMRIVGFPLTKRSDGMRNEIKNPEKMY